MKKTWYIISTALVLSAVIAWVLDLGNMRGNLSDKSKSKPEKLLKNAQMRCKDCNCNKNECTKCI